MDEAERKRLGALIRSQRERKFGTKAAAYNEARLNSTTWSKAEAGEPIRGDILRRIVRMLWPETDGDWTLVGQESSESEAEALRELVDELRKQLADQRDDIADLRRRIEGA